MEWNTTWEDPSTSYVKHFAGLIGDQRTRKTFGEIVKGIITAGSLICQQIAAQSAELSKGKKGAQRVIRLAAGASTKRSEVDAEHLTKRLREVAVEQLAQAPEFVSEPAAVQVALQTVSQALAPLKEQKRVTWLLDSGFDDVAVWRTSWEQQEHVVLRIYHTERKVAFQDRQGE